MASFELYGTVRYIPEGIFDGDRWAELSSPLWHQGNAVAACERHVRTHNASARIRQIAGTHGVDYRDAIIREFAPKEPTP